MKLNFKDFLMLQEDAAITAAPDNSMHPGVSNNPPTPVMQHPYKNLGVFNTVPNQGKVFNLQMRGTKSVCFNIPGSAGACIPYQVWEKKPFKNGDTVSIDYFMYPRDAQKGKPTRDIASVSVIKRAAGG